MLLADDIDTRLETESADNCLDMLLLPGNISVAFLLSRHSPSYSCKYALTGVRIDGRIYGMSPRQRRRTVISWWAFVIRHRIFAIDRLLFQEFD